MTRRRGYFDVRDSDGGHGPSTFHESGTITLLATYLRKERDVGFSGLDKYILCHYIFLTTQDHSLRRESKEKKVVKVIKGEDRRDEGEGIKVWSVLS